MAKRVGTEKGRNTSATTRDLVKTSVALEKKYEGQGVSDKNDQYRMQEVSEQLLRRKKNEDAAAGKTRLTVQDKKY